MSNGWYQLEHNRPRKGVPYLPGGTPRREPYIPVTRSTASEPPIPERLPQEPPAPPVRQRETEPAPLVEAVPAEEQCCFANKLRKIFIQSAKKKRRLKGF